MDRRGPDDPSRESVRRTYDRIGEHFAKTREYPWPEIETFVEGAADGHLGLDLGCGNARHVPLVGERTDRVVGVDVSRSLLAVARERIADRFDPDRTDFVLADATTLPLSSRSVDLAVYVATLHHLPDRRSRIASLDELARVLSDDGRALVSVWSTTHDRFDREEGFDTTVDWTLPGGETVARFYHVYDPAEFERDLADSDLAVVETFRASGNCYARVGPD